MNTIEITGIQDVPETTCLLEIDEYVPLRFRSYEAPIGAAYVRVGNYSTTLTELIVKPATNMLRGITLTSFERYVDWPPMKELGSVQGLPMLSVEWGKQNWIDIERDFSVSLQDSRLLIAWGDMTDLSDCAVCGRAQFLIAGNELRGVRFVELTREEVRLLTAHAPQAN